MKHGITLTALIAALGLAGACGSSSDAPSSTGGSTGSDTGGSTGTGGKSSTGGQTGSTGGSTGTGGASSGGSTGTGGTSSGGSTGTGGSSDTGGSTGTGGAGSGGSTGTGGSGGSTGGAGGSSAGGTSVSGTVFGKPFNSAAAAVWIGMPDPGPNGLTANVLYIFEKAVPCSAISHTGWDGPGTFSNNQVLEFRALGPVPHAFKVVGPPPPGATATATGEVAVNHVDNSRGAGAEQIFNGGTVTIDAVVPKMSMKGTFDVKFAMGELKGSFDATYCPTGVEP
jgi:hypothetical protein